MNDTLNNTGLSGRQLDLLRLVFVASGEAHPDLDSDPYEDNRCPVPLSLLEASGFTLDDIQGCAYLEENNGSYLLKEEAKGLQLSGIDFQSIHCQKLIDYLAEFDYYRALEGKFDYYDCFELINAVNVISFFKYKKHDVLYRLCEKISEILEALGDDNVSLVYRAMWKYEKDRGITIDINKRIRQYCKAGSLFMSLARKLINNHDVEFKTKVCFLLAEIEHSTIRYYYDGYPLNEAALALAKLNDVLNDPLMREHNEEDIKCSIQYVNLSKHITTYSNNLKIFLPQMVNEIQDATERLNAAIEIETFKERNTDADWEILLKNLKTYIDDGLQYGLAYKVYPLIELCSDSKCPYTVRTQFYGELISYLEPKKETCNSRALDGMLLKANMLFARALVASGQCGDALVNACNHFYNTDYLFRKPRIFFDILDYAGELCKKKNDYTVLLSLLLISYRLFLKHGRGWRLSNDNDFVDKLKHAFYQSGRMDDFDDWLTARLLDGGLK